MESVCECVSVFMEPACECECLWSHCVSVFMESVCECVNVFMESVC